MSDLTTKQIRSSFIDYFKNNNHTHLPSSSLIPYNDPSLMFVNSGMVQFKDIFTGNEKRPYKRATTSQKCVRAGGKHNDLENVGYTARHHTFFEMLGNFSFGDYFKEEAIYYAWKLLTENFNLPKKKLYVTVYYNDAETALYWRKIANLPEERIIRINSNDNFWSMGDLGPCGPCTEIFYDHGEHIAGGLPGTSEQDGDRFIEIYNIVFMQFEQISKEKRIALPDKSVDTGMGLERIAAVIQGVHNNYDTDLFRELISFNESIIRVKPQKEALFSYRIIADHLRSSAFLIADGIMPANEGRGYVLRRIMRRAMRHIHSLGAKEPVMYQLLPKLTELFSSTFPEIKRAEALITNTLKQEEERFKVTLERGLRLLDEATKQLPGNVPLAGDIAFKLYDTYGFPLDLTEDILKKQNRKVDIEGFERKMQEQKDKARKAWAGSGEIKTSDVWFDIAGKYGATEFLGYVLDQAEGIVLALLQDGKRVKTIQSGTSEGNSRFILITNQTPFYGESGGQMGDIGTIKSGNANIKVIDTLKYLGKIHAHICQLESGTIGEGDQVTLSIDNEYRKYLQIHHSATHLLHAVLRKLLGTHITQKGSLVAHNRLRFDFSHNLPITKNEIRMIEEEVNKLVTANLEITTKLMATQQAINAGAIALFGEKYEQEVRVVSMGNQSMESQPDLPYSLELCGGTHAIRTGDIGTFKITSQSSVAAGIRRIEAACAKYALHSFYHSEELLEQVSDILKVSKPEIKEKINYLIAANKKLTQELEQYKLNKLKFSSKELDEKTILLGKNKLLYLDVADMEPKIVRIAAEQLINNFPKLIVILNGKVNNKLSIIIAVSADITPQYHAGEIAKKIAALIGGSGGGQSTLAQVGSSEIDNLPDLKEKIIKILGEIFIRGQV